MLRQRQATPRVGTDARLGEIAVGSIITLGLESLELDWGKNSYYHNHSRLFLPSDVAQAQYHYVDHDTEQTIVEEKPAFVRPLRSVLRRLELLGYTLTGCRRAFEESVALIPDHFSEPCLDFTLFARVVAAVDPARMSLPDLSEGCDLGEYVVRNILADPEFTKTAEELSSLTVDDGTFFENLDPYITLRLLGENPANLDRQVIWRYADVVEGGWAADDQVYEGLYDMDRFLIVTEGSSDSAILRKSLPRVAPDVSDFFNFVDMSDNYPFTGTGNLVRFCQGLAQIKIQNRILVLLDNDVAGRQAHARIRDLPLPLNMVTMVLPDLEEFRHVRTLGATGEHYEDVNGRAVAIEAFLDLAYGGRTEPSIRWTSYDKNLDAYQGELTEKDSYVRDFMKPVGGQRDYDLPKLERLWTAIIACCGGGT